jgi:hypothetical protein
VYDFPRFGSGVFEVETEIVDEDTLYQLYNLLENIDEPTIMNFKLLEAISGKIEFGYCAKCEVEKGSTSGICPECSTVLDNS